jgi:hypothetical protein
MATHLVDEKQTGLKAGEALRVQLYKETRALFQTELNEWANSFHPRQQKCEIKKKKTNKQKTP